MKKQSHNSTGTWVLQIVFATALISGAAVLAMAAASGSSESNRLFNWSQQQTVQDENPTTPNSPESDVNFALATVQSPQATITVTSTADGPGNAANCPGAGCRLRDAITKAASSGDTITFSVTGVVGSPGTELEFAL